MENKKYSMLVIALYCYEGHIKRVIEHLKTKNPLVELTILTEKVEEMENVLNDKSVNIIKYYVPSFGNHIKFQWLRFLIIKYKQRKFFAKFSRGKKYDIVNVHFANKYMSYVCKYLRAMSPNLVITPWGSDVLRRDSTTLKQLSVIYNSADYIITFPHTILGQKIIKEMGVAPEKFVGNFFGSEMIDFAIKNGENITETMSKDYFGLTGRYVVTCGYNRQEAQQHKAIIKAIEQKRKQLPENLILLFPMTYGNMVYQGKYVEEVKEECKKRNLQAVFVMDFLSVEDLYKLRKATDMFVHIQTTDASSASIREYILCDKKIVHGSWIKYPELECFSPLFYYPVDDLQYLGEAIVKAYNSDKIAQSDDLLNLIKNEGWETTASKMNDFFMSIV